MTNELGEDQSKWLEKYMSINLHHWRWITIDQKGHCGGPVRSRDA